METKNHGKNAYLIFLCIVSAAAVTMRTVASFLHLSPLGYYTGTLATAADYTVLFGLLALLTFALTHRKDIPPKIHAGSPLTYVPAAPLAATLIFFGASFLFQKTEGSLEKIAFPILGLLALAGAFYFFLAVFFEKSLCDLRAVFGAILALYLILYAGYLYFDTALPINAATKICDQVAYIACSVFFLLETRASLGRVPFAIYATGGLAASLLTAYSAIPSLLVYLFEGRLIPNRLEDLLVLVMLSAYVFCRTTQFMITRSQTPTALMAALQAEAKMRTEQIAAQGPLPFEPQPAKAEDFEEEGEETEDEEDEAHTAEDEAIDDGENTTASDAPIEEEAREATAEDENEEEAETLSDAQITEEEK